MCGIERKTKETLILSGQNIFKKILFLVKSLKEKLDFVERNEETVLATESSNKHHLSKPMESVWLSFCLS